MPSTYPTTLDTTTSLSTAVNSLTAILNGDHNAVTTTITVNSTAGAPSAGYAYVDSEVIRYTGTTGTTLTGCTRGADGTAAALHTNGASVRFALVADHHNSLVTAVIGLQTKVGTNTHGASASTIDGFQLAPASVNYSKLVIPLVGNLRHTTAYRMRATNTGDSGGLTNATFLKVGLTVEDYDDNSNYDNVISRYTAPITGYYLVMATVCYVPNTTAATRFIATIYKNGTELNGTRGSVVGSINQTINVHTGPTILKLTAGDYIELFGWQNSGTTLPVFKGAVPGDVCMLTIHYVSE